MDDMYTRETKKKWLTKFYDSKLVNDLSDNALNQLYAATQPIKVSISSLSAESVNNYRIKSVDGWVKAHEWRNKGKKNCVTIKTKTDRTITSSTDHFFELSNDTWKYAAYLLPGDQLVTENGLEECESITNAGDHVVYDFHIDHCNHRYYTNGFSSHNSGSGKSLFMQNLSVNWIQAGLNGVYITLELSEELCAWRIDSMLTDIATKEVFKSIDDVELKVKMAGKKAGEFYIKYMPAQSNVNDIRAYIKTLQIESGIKIDFVCIDYLDLLMPVSA